VVIPAFNPGAQLVEAVESVLAQTVDELELVVVDDGSDAGRLPELPEDSRLRVIRQANAGVSVARNRGAGETVAPLLAFLDADDRWHPEKLDRQFAALSEHPDAVMCHTGFQIIDPGGHQVARGEVRNACGYHELLRGVAICMSSVVIRREAFASTAGFDPFYAILADFDLWMRLSMLGPFTLVDEPLVEYRMSPHMIGQMSGDPWAAFIEGRSIFDRHQAHAERRGDAEAVELLEGGRRHTVRHRSALAAGRFVDSLVAAEPEWDMLTIAWRISPRTTMTSVSRAGLWKALRWARDRTRNPSDPVPRS
jgi:glycosyltransferase involved in cell wall biosynthesis